MSKIIGNDIVYDIGCDSIKIMYDIGCDIIHDIIRD